MEEEEVILVAARRVLEVKGMAGNGELEAWSCCSGGGIFDLCILELFLWLLERYSLIRLRT